MFNDGGPAFPQLEVEAVAGREIVTTSKGGMSIWDEYAKAAITGYLAWSPPTDGGTRLKPETVAEYAADIADAMIAEREKRRANHPES
jgi:hypothetical protein